jgi:HK97 gp10 family phage protein
MASLKYNRLPQIERQLAEGGVTLINELADAMVRHAQENAPVRTGYLRDHIHKDGQGDEVTVVSEATYSAEVNYGTVYMPPRPFFTDAVEQARAEVEGLVRQAFR